MLFLALFFQPNLAPVLRVPVLGRREMNDTFPVLRDFHLRRIRSLIAECYPDFAVVMDGTPLFAEAECVSLRFVHKATKKIHEFVVHLGLYAESLDGNTIAKHVTAILLGRLSLDLKHWKATSIDRAATNKKAMSILHKDQAIAPFRAYCISHGTAPGCGKKADMGVGANVVKHLSAMVKHKLCKARNLFQTAFGESAKRNAGVRWGVFHEVCEQVNRIGLAQLRDRYATICLKNKWSDKSAQKFLLAIEQDYKFCIASVEIAAVVDVGHSLVRDLYL